MTVAKGDIQRKQDLALRLSLAGASPAEIAASTDPQTGEPLYKDPMSAGRALKAARARVRVATSTKADELELEIARIDRLSRALWPSATSGDVAAIRESRMLIEARARLKGVAKGLPTEESPTVGDPVDDLARRRDARRAGAQ